MLDFGFYNMDCMDGMKQFPDAYFDLAIVDPPYGINMGHTCGVGGGDMTERSTVIKVYNAAKTNYARQNFTTPLMIVPHQRQNTFRN